MKKLPLLGSKIGKNSKNFKCLMLEEKNYMRNYKIIKNK